MIHRLPAALLLSAALLAGAVAARRDDAARSTPAIPAGASQSCIPLTAIDHDTVRDDSTIDFYMRGGKVYRNMLPHPCPELGFEQRFGYETSLSQLCSTDIITVLHQSPPVRGASCGLGSFQPVTGVPRG